MNILYGDLPTKIKVNDTIYDINYDYKNIIKIIMAFEDNELTESEKIFVLLKNLYKNEIKQEDMEEACLKAMKFIDCGKQHHVEKDETPRIYSFEQDANYIYSGIIQTHNVDLEKEKNMHWWKFMSLFMDMSSECTFGELIYYRKRKAEGKLTKEEKEQYNKIKDIIELQKTNIKSKAREEFFRRFNQN